MFLVATLIVKKQICNTIKLQLNENPSKLIWVQGNLPNMFIY